MIMRRREFISLLGGAVVARPLAARAQQAGKVYRVGVIFTTAPVSEMTGPRPTHPSERSCMRLRDLGYVEGRNLVLERRSAEGRFERFGDIVAELVRLKADVIVTSGNPTARAAKAVTTTVPIVAAGRRRSRGRRARSEPRATRRQHHGAHDPSRAGDRGQAPASS